MTSEASERDTRRIGIYGGTFNPVHRGHLKAAREVAIALELDHVIFVPSANPPHKTDVSNDPIAPAADRIRWVELAVEDIADFEVDGLELERAGASYSFDTLTQLTQELAPARLFFILGHDAFIEMGTWRAPDKILEMVDVVVMSRPPMAPGALGEWLPEFARDLVDIAADGKSAKNRNSNTSILVLDIDALMVSASEIRQRVKAGDSISEQVPEAALDEIVSSGHYGGPARSGDLDTRAHAAKGNKVEAAKTQAPEPLSDKQRAKLVTVVEAALERNADKPVAMNVSSLTSYTDCVVVVTGNSNRQLKSICENIVTALKHTGDQPLGVEGGNDSSWMLIDANDVIVHVFEPDTRELFDIEGLWTDAPRIELDIPGAAESAQEVQVPSPTA
jgi:nicotinate-nucleotide adenylyltransferase